MRDVRIGFWILLAATFVIGVAAIIAMRDLRLTSQRKLVDSLNLHAQVMINDINGQVNTLKAEALKQIDGDWFEVENKASNHPLVRNVFHWQEGRGLIYPIQPMSSEQHRFLTRFDRLFSSSDLVGRLNQSETVTPDSSHWLTWFWEDKLYVLGCQVKDGKVIGVELELAMVMARLLPQLEAPTKYAIFRILDDKGQVVGIWGSTQASTSSAVVQLPLTSTLPHWTLEVLDPLGLTSWSIWAQLATGFWVFLTLTAIVASGWHLSVRARVALVEASQRSNFVSNVSHELKTPLTSIRMYAELLSENRVKDEAQQKKYLGVIVDEAHRLTRLVNNVLTFSRLDKGKQPVNKTSVSLSDLIARIQLHAQPLLEDQACELQVVMDVILEDDEIESDADALEQVLWNLIDNAIKYGRPERPKPHLVKLYVNLQPTMLEMRVEDQGPGLSAEIAKHVFDAFYRADNQLASPFAGTGIGLAIARGLMRELGGELSYKELDIGGCFVLSLPLGTRVAK